MELCDDGHDQIVYDGRECPVCAVVEKKNELAEEINTAFKQYQEDVTGKVNEMDRLLLTISRGMGLSPTFELVLDDQGVPRPVQYPSLVSLMNYLKELHTNLGAFEELETEDFDGRLD